MSHEIVVKQNFSAAHFLKHYKGKCERMHGHTFKIEVFFKVESMDKSGISIDFSEIKEYLKELLPDHEVLNNILPFSPSAENLSQHFFSEIKKKYPVSKVVVWESEDAGAVYTED